MVAYLIDAGGFCNRTKGYIRQNTNLETQNIRVCAQTSQLHDARAKETHKALSFMAVGPACIDPANTKELVKQAIEVRPCLNRTQGLDN